jgi:hypothetical protein
MAIQYFIPGWGYVNETAAQQYLIPGWGYINEAQSGTSYSLALGAGSYAVTGQNAALTIGRNLALASGTYTITGRNATLTYTSSGVYTLALGSGSYAISGNAMKFTAPQTSGGGYIADAYAKFKPKIATVAEIRSEIEHIDEEIAQTEKRDSEREARIAKRQFEEISALQAELEAQLQEKINGLRMERIRLMRRIDDEEAILALLLSMPLH